MADNDDFTLGSLLSESWNNMKDKMAMAILIPLVGMILFFMGYYIPPLLGILIWGGPLLFGIYGAMLAINRNEEVEFGKLFSGFGNFGRCFSAFFFYVLFNFLWTLLFYIPGIIAALRHAFIFFIMQDDHEIAGNAARKKSIELTKGHKGKIFVYSLVCIIPIIGPPLGIGAMALLYDRLK